MNLSKIYNRNYERTFRDRELSQDSRIGRILVIKVLISELGIVVETLVNRRDKRSGVSALAEAKI